MQPSEDMTSAAHAPRNRPSNRPWIGFALGLALGACDLVVLSSIGVEMRHGEIDMMLPVMGVFTLTFGALGYAIGRLLEARNQIRHQLVALEDAQRQALEFEKLASIGRMAASVAHEVRNPLGVIQSSAALLVDCVDPEDRDAVTAGEFIAAEIARLDGFIRSLLDYARPLTVERAEVDGAELRQRIEEVCRPIAADAGASLEVHEEAGTYWVDADLVARAVTTLVVNATQAAGDGGRIHVGMARDADGSAEITVSDDGPGVDDEVADTLFEPFVTTKAKGTGLGLPMAARIAEAHAGALASVARAGLGAQGTGACFRMRLPRGAGS